MLDLFSLHPATRIIFWIALAIFAFSADPRALVALSLALALILWLQGGSGFFRLLRRIRWILISLLMIYALATQGTPLVPEIGGPTLEGLVSGATQAWRIVLTIALLAVLQGSTSREKMLSGIYTLLLPLKRFGVRVERIAVRLLLTLHYAEEKKTGNWRERIQDAFREKECTRMDLSIILYRFRIRDGVAFLALAAVLML